MDDNPNAAAFAEFKKEQFQIELANTIRVLLISLAIIIPIVWLAIP